MPVVQLMEPDQVEECGLAPRFEPDVLRADEALNVEYFYGLQNQINVKFIDSEFPITRIKVNDVIFR